MKKYGFYLMIATLCVATSCKKENDDAAIEAWRTANEQAFNKIKNNPEYTEFKSPGKEGSIYYKSLKKGTGTKSIFYTSTVKIYAKGWFVVNNKEYNITKGTVFQEWTANHGVPVSLSVSRAVLPFSVKGIQVALQKMVEGDKWEVWVPYQLSSGANNISILRHFGLDGKGGSGQNSTIPAYSTLVFEIEVVGVKQ